MTFFLVLSMLNLSIWLNSRPLGQEIRGDICNGTVSAQYEDFYVRPISDDMSDTSPQYSLFEDHIDDDREEADEPIVSYGQHIDGRVSTFVHTPERTGEHNLQYINENDDITPL